MALKRISGKELILVANEYFEKLGVSRQVVEYRRASKQIHAFLMVKGVNLYYKLDADILILRYWMNSFRRFIAEWERSKEIRRGARKQKTEVQARWDGFGDEWTDPGLLADEHLELESAENEGTYSSEFYELTELIGLYRLSKERIKQKKIEPTDPRITVSDEIDDFLFRVCAYEVSGLKLNEYLRKEKSISTRSPNYYDVLVRFSMMRGMPINTDIAFKLRNRLFASLCQKKYA